jgi:HlyD family secretion protein
VSPPFRSDSLDSLVSTDDLDQASSLIRFRSFFFLLIFGLLLVVFILCSFFVKVPISVAGPSVIWSDVGVLQVAAKDPGSITSLSVKVGDRIEAGQEIGVLDQSSVEDQLFSLRYKLNALLKYISDIEDLQEKDLGKRLSLRKSIESFQENSEKLNTTRINRLEERKKELKKLYDKELLVFDQYNSVVESIEQTESAIINEQRSFINELKEENNKFVSDSREVLQKKLEADQLSSEVTLLESQLISQGKLTSPISGRVVEITASVGDFLSPGSPVVLVQPDSKEDQLTFVVFISSEQVKPVKPGMRTELELSAFPPTQFGKLVAEVTSISPMPLSSSGLMKELRNDQLVNRITESGSPFMARVEILRDEETGEFVWSSSSDSKRELQVGMVGEGSIITRYERLIWLLLPQTE